MVEAQLDDFGSGRTPVSHGWFVVNVRDAEWWFAETRGARCAFENEYGDAPIEFEQVGINVTVLEPGQRSLYHAEANQEAFLVVSGECALLAEDEQRRLRPWDLFHSPPWTEHAFVGAGEAPCVILMVETGVRNGRAVPSRAAAELGSSALGVDSLSVIPEHRRRRGAGGRTRRERHGRLTCVSGWAH